VKAVDENGEEVYYRPIEIMTSWGGFSKLGESHKFTIGAFVILAIIVILIIIRRSRKAGYQPLN
jgi:hypothetical protein